MAAESADVLLSKIVDLIENEADLLGGARDELEELKLELLSMRSFLEDTDKTRPQTEGEKTWVSNVRNLVYDVEDIIDEFMYYTNKRRRRNQFTRTLYKTIGFPKYLWQRHQIASRLQKIKRQIKSVHERNQRYGVDHIQGTSSSEGYRAVIHSESSLFIKDDELVGIEDEKQLLVGLLTDGEQRRATISVVGMGGSGKTTLVAKAYNFPPVKRYFHCCAWITVSQTYVIEDLFRSLIKQFYQARMEALTVTLSSLNYRQLVEMLVNYLESKRYIVVLDDVWSPNLWHEIKVSLPNGRLGSRVMLTTRNEDVASHSFEVGSYVHHIRLLSENESWTLFCMKAFARNSNKCPIELETLANNIVAKCQGLPLAIVALGGLLSAKSSETEWRRVYNNVSWELHKNPMLGPVKAILLLSYNGLPYRLKRCFLYCCLFPEDYEIKKKRLVRLWMAEGFVEYVRGITPEDVAQEYMLELIRRSMLQAVGRNLLGLPKACKMHDLLRELALSISEEEKFCYVYDEQRVSSREEGMARRLSIQAINKENKLCGGMSQLRSFFSFVTDKVNPFFLDKLTSSFKLLRVLDLEKAPIENLPDDITTLFNLRYLSLKKSSVKQLPKSIDRLHNLETLNMKGTNIEALPKGIVKLQNLRYLLARRYHRDRDTDFNFVSGVKIPSDISSLKNLQVLGCVESNTEMIKQLRGMTQLVRLELFNVTESDEVDLCSAIQNMPLLNNLLVMGRNHEVLRMDALKSSPPSLRTLSLIGKLEKIPEWFHTLQNLSFLWLRWSSLERNPALDLAAFPNLRVLYIAKVYNGKNLDFLEGFNRLEILNLLNCPELETITIADGVMPSLKFLRIGYCDKLTRIPWGIDYLTNLQELELIDVPKPVIDCIRAPSGIYRTSVQHISDITNFSSTSSGWSWESLS